MNAFGSPTRLLDVISPIRVEEQLKWDVTIGHGQYFTGDAFSDRSKLRPYFECQRAGWSVVSLLQDKNEAAVTLSSPLPSYIWALSGPGRAEIVGATKALKFSALPCACGSIARWC